MPATVFNEKAYLWKIYDSAGNFITTWKDVISNPEFSWEINGGFSELVVDLARSVFSFGENSDVDYGNQLKLYVFDRDSGENGTLIYSGFISRYEPVMEGSKESVRITFLGYWSETNMYMLENGSGDTQLAYNSNGPEDILKAVLDIFVAAGGKVDYDGSSVDDPTTTVSYTFNTNTVQEALLKVLELSPDGWYFRIGADDILHYREKSATPDHTFHMGRSFINYRQEKRTENLVNKVYFSGGGSPKLYKVYEAASSISAYGLHIKKIVDERVSVEATADTIADRILTELSDPEIRITIDILDNNGEKTDRGYDIESIKPGDTCKILGATDKGYNLWDNIQWDVDAWDYDITNAAATTLQIMKITYYPNYARLEISNRQPDITKRIEDINRNLTNAQTADNPETPTS